MSVHVNGVSFACTMRGRMCFGEEDCDRGAASGCPVEIRARLKIDDSERFAAGEGPPAAVIGSVCCEDLGGDRPIESGTVAILPPRNGDQMSERWLLQFSDGVGHPLTLTGHKHGLKMPVHLHAGRVGPHEEGAEPIAAGSVAPGGLDLMRQFASMRGEGATLGEGAASVRRVAGPYAQVLLDAYRGRARG